MAIVYKQCQDDTPIIHVCDPCQTPEHGGVRSAFLVKSESTIKSTSTLQEWNTAIENGEVIIIPETRGTYDGGTAKMGSGYGDKKERLLGYDFISQLKDPDFKSNYDFWAWAEKQEWRYGFRSESSVFITEKEITITTKAPIEEDTETEVVWNVEVKWFDGNKPKLVELATIKDLFRCFEVTS